MVNQEDIDNIDNLAEEQKDSLIKNKDFSVIPFEKWNIPIPEINIKRCSKCGCGLFIGFYVTRKILFRKSKKYCYNCYNKLKFVKKLEIKDNSISGKMAIGNNIHLLSSPNSLQIPKENVILKSYTKLDVISDNDYIPIKKVSDTQLYSNDNLSSIWSHIEKFIKKLELSTFKIINISTGKDISNDLELEISDKEDDCEFCGNKYYKKVEMPDIGCVNMCNGCYESYMDCENCNEIDRDLNIPIKMASHIYDDSNVEILSIKNKKDSKPFKEMKSECFDCGRNIGFKNIPSEICYECSIYDIEKLDNKFKPKTPKSTGFKGKFYYDYYPLNETKENEKGDKN